MRFPRVTKAQPWAGICERFQRYVARLDLTRKEKLAHGKGLSYGFPSFAEVGRDWLDTSEH
jgi:hypothetical protein